MNLKNSKLNSERDWILGTLLIFTSKLNLSEKRKFKYLHTLPLLVGWLMQFCHLGRQNIILRWFRTNWLSFLTCQLSIYGSGLELGAEVRKNMNVFKNWNKNRSFQLLKLNENSDSPFPPHPNFDGGLVNVDCWRISDIYWKIGRDWRLLWWLGKNYRPLLPSINFLLGNFLKHTSIQTRPEW